jgi:hypothetical protein
MTKRRPFTLYSAAKLKKKVKHARGSEMPKVCRQDCIVVSKTRRLSTGSSRPRTGGNREQKLCLKIFCEEEKK